MTEPQNPRSPDDSLAEWEAGLAQRLESLRDLPPPPSFGPEATEQFLRRLTPHAPRVVRRRAALPMGVRFAAALTAVLLALSSVGYVAAQSLPGDPLYGLKRRAEAVELALTPATQKEQLALTLADRRLEEVSQLVERGAQAEQVAAGVAEYQAAAAVIGWEPVIPGGEERLRHHVDVLLSLEQAAPKESHAALETAQQAAKAQLSRYDQAAPAPTAPAAPPQPTVPPPTPSAVPSATAAATSAPAEPSATATATATETARPTDKPRPRPTQQPEAPIATAEPPATARPTQRPKPTRQPEAPVATTEPTEGREPVQPTERTAEPTAAGEPTRPPRPDATPQPPTEPGEPPRPTEKPPRPDATEKPARPTEKPEPPRPPEPPRQPEPPKPPRVKG